MTNRTITNAHVHNRQCAIQGQLGRDGGANYDAARRRARGFLVPNRLWRGVEAEIKFHQKYPPAPSRAPRGPGQWKGAGGRALAGRNAATRGAVAAERAARAQVVADICVYVAGELQSYISAICLEARSLRGAQTLPIGVKRALKTDSSCGTTKAPQQWRQRGRRGQ